jgi:Sporulation and spore germination
MRDRGRSAGCGVRFQRVAVVAFVALLLGACGIATDPSPRLINKKDVPYGLLSRPPTTATVSVGEYVTIYLDGPKRLVAVSRAIPAPASVVGVLEALEEGPTTAEAAQGLASPISTAGPLVLSRLGPTSVTVSLSPSFTSLGGQEQIVAVAQLVYTVTALPGIDRVDVRIGGRAAAVPTGDGNLSKTPVSRSEYSLLAPI